MKTSRAFICIVDSFQAQKQKRAGHGYFSAESEDEKAYYGIKIVHVQHGLTLRFSKMGSKSSLQS